MYVAISIAPELARANAKTMTAESAGTVVRGGVGNLSGNIAMFMVAMCVCVWARERLYLHVTEWQP